MAKRLDDMRSAPTLTKLICLQVTTPAGRRKWLPANGVLLVLGMGTLIKTSRLQELNTQSKVYRVFVEPISQVQRPVV